MSCRVMASDLLLQPEGSWLCMLEIWWTQSKTRRATQIDGIPWANATLKPLFMLCFSSKCRDHCTTCKDFHRCYKLSAQSSTRVQVQGHMSVRGFSAHCTRCAAMQGCRYCSACHQHAWLDHEWPYEP